MSNVRTLHVKSRLSTLIKRPGGITVLEAIKRSDAMLALCRDSGVAAIDLAIDEIEALFAVGSAAPSNEERERFYFLSTQIIDVATCLPDSGIEKAAYAFCDLIDLCISLDAWDRQCIEIHINALKLLRQTGAQLSGRERDQMIEGLGKITERRLADSLCAHEQHVLTLPYPNP